MLNFTRFATLFLFAALLMTGPNAHAQSPETQQFEQQIRVMNRSGINISPELKNYRDLFSMRIIDSNRQVVGRVEDIMVYEDGTFARVISEIDRVGRKNHTVETDASSAQFREDISAIQIPLVLDPQQAQDVSPEALAAITPAAGGGQILSLKAMKGAEVRNDRGRWVGKVSDVIFGGQGQGIQALELEDVPGARPSQRLVVPYNPDVFSVNNDYGRIQFRMTPEAAEALTGYAWQLR